MLAPGPWLAWLVVAGVALGVASYAAAPLAVAAALAAASLAVAFERGPLRRLLGAGVLAALAVAHGAAARDRALAPPLVAWFDAQVAAVRADAPLAVTGVIAEDAALVDDAARLVVDVARICDGDECWPVAGRVQLRVTGAAAPEAARRWTRGRAVRAPALLREPDVRRNPGGPSEAWQRLRRTADLIGTVKSARLVEVVPGAWHEEWAARLRAHVRAAAADYVAPRSAQSAAIVTAILIGDRAGLDDDVVRQLQMAGTYHVIAISGGNVALLAAVCAVLLRGLTRSWRASAAATMAVVALYGWIVGGGASVDRAVVGACVYLGASAIGLRPRGVIVLGAAAAILALADPLVTIDVSAWLSFGASLGIILCSSRFVRWVRGQPEPGDSAVSISRPRTSPSWIERVVWTPMLALFSATLAAEVALAPISAVVFGRVGIAGLVLNFIAIPAMSVVEIGGLVTAGLAGWWDAGARAAAAVTSGAAWALVTSAGAVTLAPWLSWRVPPTPAAWTVVFYVSAAIFLARRDWRWPRVASGVTAAACLGVIVTAPGVGRAGPPPGWLRFTLVDVGQGDAIAVQFPAGSSLLVDAGGASGSFDIGSRVVTPALWALGIRRLDYLAFTHPDLDHIGGAAGVARDLAPREIWEGVPVPPNPARRALVARATEAGVAWRPLAAPETLRIGSVVVDVENPPPPDWERQKSRNEDSIVLRLRFGDVEVWLTGDAGGEFESRVLASRGLEDRPAPLRLIKVGHHGSRSSSTAPFVSALGPQLAFISVGASNLFGHPAADVVARYADAGAQVFRTDQDGAIIVETDGRDVFVRTMTGRTWAEMLRRRP